MSSGGTKLTARRTKPDADAIRVVEPTIDHVKHVVVEKVRLFTRCDNINFNCLEPMGSDGG